MSTPTLKLTGIIKPGDSPGVFIGCIKEISGIIAQGNSVDAVYADLIEGTRGMLEYKREEALALLKEQQETQEGMPINASLEFSLEKILQGKLELA
jgi:predicted RNase H-like HicB family nuclease